MGEEKPRGRIQLQWVVDEDSPEVAQMVELEKRRVEADEARLAQSQQIHKDWKRDRELSREHEKRDQQIWTETHSRAIGAFERIATALEEIAVKGWPR